MSRLSCCFCIMANTADLTTAARLAPELYRRYVETERRLDFTLSPSRKFLTEITGIEPAPAA
jgi:DNA sulfur modification protein DndC